MVFVRQYRHGSDEISLEIPGGMIDPGEEPKVAAASMFGGKWHRAEVSVTLGALRPNLPSSRIICSVFAHNVTEVGEIQNTATEETELVLADRGAFPS